jgi:hypothetical protein
MKRKVRKTALLTSINNGSFHYQEIEEQSFVAFRLKVQNNSHQELTFINIYGFY